jgi:predicted transcriptional regulator
MTKGNTVEQGATVHIGARLPVDLVAKLHELARREDRSVSAEIRRAVERHVNERQD